MLRVAKDGQIIVCESAGCHGQYWRGIASRLYIIGSRQIFVQDLYFWALVNLFTSSYGFSRRLFSSYSNPHALVDCVLGLHWIYVIRIDKVKKVVYEWWRCPGMSLMALGNLQMNVWAFAIDEGTTRANAVVKPVAPAICREHSSTPHARC